MPRKGKSLSFFAALPPTIKRALRSQPAPERTASPEPLPATESEPNPDDLWPTQPARSSIDEAAVSDHGEGSDMDLDASEHSEAVEAPVDVAVGSAELVADDLGPDVPVASSSAVTLAPASVVRSVKREAPWVATPPPKRRKGKGKPPVFNAFQGHAWDCTGLVPRYANPSEVPVHLKKYFYQRHSLFPDYSRLPLLMDETGWFSVTPAHIAEHIAERCRSDVVLDAFCGVGGNAIAFARTCERVIAMDIDPVRLRLARHNALHYGVADRIEFIQCDYVEWAREYARRGAGSREEVDVVFLSPPWGGPEYLNDSEGEPRAYPLSAILPIPGDELFALSSVVSPNIAYFLPRNMDVDELSALAAPLESPVVDGDGGRERAREWVEVQEEWVGEKLKAVTAYFGGLVQGA